MGKIYFTADFHLGHKNIIKYCKRPFKSLKEMDDTIISNVNKIVTKDDLIYHIGDFAFRGKSAREYEKLIKSPIVHILGNHDYNNGVRSKIISAIMEFGGKIIFAQHHPPRNINEIPLGCDFVICGHVHEKWKYQIIDGIPIINVGVDVWEFKPISIYSLMRYYHKILKGYI